MGKVVDIRRYKRILFPDLENLSRPCSACQQYTQLYFLDDGVRVALCSSCNMLPSDLVGMKMEAA